MGVVNKILNHGQVISVLNKTSAFPITLNEVCTRISAKNNDGHGLLNIVVKTKYDGDIIIPVSYNECADFEFSEFQSIDVVDTTSIDYTIAVQR